MVVMDKRKRINDRIRIEYKKWNIIIKYKMYIK